MSIRPQPTFNDQCPIHCIAVLEEKDLIATLNYDCELVIRRISDKKIIYHKTSGFASNIHFLGTNLLIFTQYYFMILDWENDIILKERNGFVFSNLKYYLSYDDNTFKLKALIDDTVYWEKNQSGVDSFSAKMANDSILIETVSKSIFDYQLWKISVNKQIDFKSCILKEINLTIDNYLLDASQFINDGKEILIEQFHFNCWRVIVFSLESLQITENLILGKDSYLPRANYNRIFCYKDKIYFLQDENKLMEYDRIRKHLNSITPAFMKSNYIEFFIFDEKFGTVYLFGVNEILTWQINSGEKYLIDFDLLYRLDESTLFNNLTMYASSFSGGIIKVDLKSNDIKSICYASGHVNSSHLLNNKIFNLSDSTSIALWDLKTNKIRRRKKTACSYFKETFYSSNKLYFESTNYLKQFITQFEFDENLKIISKKKLPLKTISQEFALGSKLNLLIFHKLNQTLSFNNSTTNWSKEVPELFETRGSFNVCTKTQNGYAYFALDALYKVNLENGDLTKSVIFRKHDPVDCMRIENDYLFMGMEGFCIYIIDLKSFQVLHKISTDHESAHSLVYCQNRSFLFVASYYSTEITIFDVFSGKLVHSWKAHKSNLSKLFYLEDQNVLLSVSNNGSMRKWDYNTFELLDEYYTLPAMPDKNYKKGWAHIDRHGKLRGSIHCKNYFNTITK